MFRVIAILLGLATSVPAIGQSISSSDCAEVLTAAQKATEFLTEKVSTRGGYLWRYSADLKFREGEGVVKSETVWVQPPGTPSVGEAYVRLFRATGDPQFRTAALAVASALKQGQMRSGGWQASVEFGSDRQKKWAYRVFPPHRKRKDQSSLDDDKTQSALRFLIQLDAALKFNDPVVSEMVRFGLDSLLNKGQFSGGGFPQVWMDERPPQLETPSIQASFPNAWPREYPGHQEYWNRYTLNDHLARDVMKVLLLAHDTYDDDRYIKAAIRLADSLLHARLPDPQPAWAQQYNERMQPIWARKFEPPAVTSSESFSVIETLMLAHTATGDDRYLDPIPAALDYLKTCEFPDGQIARFYELKTNRPLYFTRDYQLTYDDSDVPTHYAFKLRSQVDRLRKALGALDSRSKSDRGKSPSAKEIESILSSQDKRGAWVSETPMKYHKHPGPIIDMQTTVKNLNTLADFLRACAD